MLLIDNSEYANLIGWFVQASSVKEFWFISISSMFLTSEELIQTMANLKLKCGMCG